MPQEDTLQRHSTLYSDISVGFLRSHTPALPQPATQEHDGHSHLLLLVPLNDGSKYLLELFGDTTIHLASNTGIGDAELPHASKIAG